MCSFFCCIGIDRQAEFEEWMVMSDERELDVGYYVMNDGMIDQGIIRD